MARNIPDCHIDFTVVERRRGQTKLAIVTTTTEEICPETYQVGTAGAFNRDKRRLGRPPAAKLATGWRALCTDNVTCIAF
jgi:hypothetical protein